jgi:hypothetical protein
LDQHGVSQMSFHSHRTLARCKAKAFAENRFNGFPPDKSFTFFYDLFEASSFDAVLVPLGLEPTVQYSIYLRMQYEFKKPKLN